MLQDMGMAVIYPGLPAHPQHQRAGLMANDGFGYGGIIAMDCGSRKKAEALMEVFKTGKISA